MRVLLVPSSDYLGHPFPQRSNQLFERLGTLSDFEVHVVRFKLYNRRLPETRLIVHNLPGSNVAGLATYYAFNAVRHIEEIRRIVKANGIDLVVLQNLMAPFGFQLLNQFSNLQVKTVLDLSDYFPTSAVGYVVESESFIGVTMSACLRTMVAYLLRHCDAVTVVSSALFELAVVMGAKKVHQVPNGIGEEFMKEHDKESERRGLGFAKDDFVVGYIGSIDFWLDLQKLVRGIRLARDQGIAMKCLFIGRGLHNMRYPDKVKRWIRDEQLSDDVVWKDFVPYSEVPKYMAALDVGLIPFDPSNLTAYYSSPNKMWEYLSQGTPVISTPIPEAVANRDCVLLAKTPDDYAQHFRSVRQGINIISEMTTRGKSISIGRTWSSSAQLLADEYRKVIED